MSTVIGETSRLSMRLACVEDLPAVVDIVQRVLPKMHAIGNYQWNDKYPLHADFKKDVDNADLWLVVEQVKFDSEASSNETSNRSGSERVIAVAALTEDQSPEYADCGWDLSERAIVMHRAAVHPDYHRGGVASMLFAQADVLSRERGYNLCRIDTNELNVAMQAVIKKAGYIFSGKIRLLSKPEHMRFMCFEKRLA